MSEQNKSILSIRDLTLQIDSDGSSPREVQYGSLELYPGDFLLIRGRNGCGKSTLLRMLRLQGTSYFSVKSGEMIFHRDGFSEKSIHKYSTDELTRLTRSVSFIGQEERFLSSDSAYSYIYNVCRIALEGDKSITPAERRARLSSVDGMICEYYEKYLSKSFDLAKYKTFKRKSVRAWSGGQQKMISVLAGIIKTKAAKLPLIVMDEPLNNLDGMNKFTLNKLISELREEGCAVMAITHCQIFGGVNKLLTIEEGEDGIRRATLTEGEIYAHGECLETYN